MEAVAEPAVGVLDRAVVVLDAGLDLVGTLVGVRRRLLEQRAVGGAGVAELDALEGGGADVAVAVVREDDAEVGEALYGRHGGVGALQGLIGLIADVDAGQGRGAARTDGIQVAPDPALGAEALGFGGLPDLHGAEVAAIGVGVADALDDGELFAVVQRLHAGHGRVQADVVGQAKYLAVGLCQGGAVPAISVVAVGDDSVEAVVAARQLDDHQGAHGARRAGVVERVPVGPDHFGEPGGNGEADGDARGGGFQKLTA